MCRSHWSSLLIWKNVEFRKRHNWCCCSNSLFRICTFPHKFHLILETKLTRKQENRSPNSVSVYSSDEYGDVTLVTFCFSSQSLWIKFWLWLRILGNQEKGKVMQRKKWNSASILTQDIEFYLQKVCRNKYPIHPDCNIELTADRQRQILLLIVFERAVSRLARWCRWELSHLKWEQFHKFVTRWKILLQ